MMDRLSWSSRLSMRIITSCFVAILAGATCIDNAHAQIRPFAGLFRSQSKAYAERLEAAQKVPLQQLHPAIRPKIEDVLNQPTLYTKGPAESFLCQPKMYHWLLNNPDRAMVAWRRLGAKCIEISNRGNGAFAWSDDKGSEVVWRTVLPGPNMRIWYAEGRVKPGPLLPTIPVQCVVVLHHGVVHRQKNSAVMHQQVDIFARTNNRAANLVTRLLGPAVPRMAKDAAAQMQMFFAAMAWYCHQHPEKAARLLRPATKDDPSSSRVLSPFEIKQSSYPDARRNP